MCGARDQWHVASDCFFHKHWCWHWGLRHLVAMKPAKWEWNGFKPPAKMFGGSRTVVVGNGVYNDVDYWCLVPSDHLGSTASKRNGKVDHQSRRYSRETVLRRNGTYSIGPMLVACGVTLILRIDFWFCWYSSSHSRFVICTKCPGVNGQFFHTFFKYSNKSI